MNFLIANWKMNVGCKDGLVLANKISNGITTNKKKSFVILIILFLIL